MAALMTKRVKSTPPKAAAADNAQQLPPRNIALIGLMGVGKTTIGRQLSKYSGRAFFDSDEEIVKASGRSISGYFQDHGEAAFRRGEAQVIKRLLSQDRIILATGGGAFIEPQTRETLLNNALAIWLHSDIDLLMERVMRNDKRPLLQVKDPRAKMLALMEQRNPIYAKAPIHIKITKGSQKNMVNRVLTAIADYETRDNSRDKPQK